MSSMARTTGLTACAAAELILAKKITEPGVMAPEMLGQSQECFDFILDYLRDHRIYYRKKKSAY
ncbi:Saccharopine dehydrogenase [compost metagenome]